MQTKQSHQEKCGFDQPPGESQKNDNTLTWMNIAYTNNHYSPVLWPIPQRLLESMAVQQ